ncbi:putative nitrogen metabolism transcriptional regulator, NtrC, Fis family [Magnetofaba australis IT-1]|uniref:DNA-binding transcriptional regulator NtrC n=1 Tax=Magnetofaba australis IT-1 TaxID=1434232 RepID=A0A1Y2K9R5_9PROT|nr:putative nitrogen metabolism transcriptional regulator, NtrC, Fis family [Magnetofaba australis IT-1]
MAADDDQAVRFVLEQSLSRAGFLVHTFNNGQDLLEHIHADGADLVITDIVMPGLSGLDLAQTLKSSHPDVPVIVITAQSTLRNAVQAFERGAFDYLAKPFDIKKLVDLAHRAMDLRKKSAKPAPPKRVEEAQPSYKQADAHLERFGGFVGSSRAMQALFRTIGRLSNSEMTVLIHGESGAGKELVARAVHDYSPRRKGPFTAINMAAIPRNLIESELFGHEKGAFTGAVSRRPGHFQKAEGGTLFLDEIGDMPMEAQTRLLRVLQEGTFTLVGSTDVLRANVRIIAATHQYLPDAIAEGRFREDLFYRLNVIPLHVPSLRSRKEDIPILCDYFLGKTAKELNIPVKRFTPMAMERMLAYDWPGNVRELENLISRMMVLTPDDEIGADRLDLSNRMVRRVEEEMAPAPAEESTVHSGAETPRASAFKQALLEELDDYFLALNGQEGSNLYSAVLKRMEEVLIPRVLKETRGNRVKAALVLGINRNTLRKKIQDLESNPF